MNPSATKTNSSAAFWLVITALVAVGAYGMGRQWLKSQELGIELEKARTEVAQVERLRRENIRLQGKQVAAAELGKLREDHAALLRLRAELDTLQNGKR
jgi:hypothetical protein